MIAQRDCNRNKVNSRAVSSRGRGPGNLRLAADSSLQRSKRSKKKFTLLFMHIHILGICGTFMGGIATIARQAGHKVTGCDANVYPPMSSQLEAQDIALIEGYFRTY